MVINNSGSENFSTQGVQSGSSNQEISFEIRVFLGVFISVLSIVGTVGNTIVITVLTLNNVFTRKTTGLILTSLAVVDPAVQHSGDSVGHLYHDCTCS